MSTRVFLSKFPKYVSGMAGHSCPNTFSLHKGPIRLTLSILAAVAFFGFQSSNLVIMAAIGLTDTRASRPAMTCLQRESDPTKPSRRNRHSWKRRARATGPRTPSSLLSDSKCLAMSWSNGATSVEESWLYAHGSEERYGPESEKRDRRGGTSSVCPTSRLRRSIRWRKSTTRNNPLRWLGELFRLL